MNSSARYFHLGASSSLVVLILLCVAWELALAPLRPGGSWMVLKVVPLLLPLRGILKRDVYTLQWSSMLILVYLAEGLVRATSDANHTSVWLAWVEVAGPLGAGDLPVLGKINRQAPTAELRPADQTQTDEKDLMPYPVLDAIERAAIRDKKMPVETFHLMRAIFGNRYGDAELGLWVERFYRLWCVNQWKRERYAPSFHLDDENLDPKTWCRFPILSGGFTRELAELDELLTRLAATAR